MNYLAEFSIEDDDVEEFDLEFFKEAFQEWLSDWDGTLEKIESVQAD